MRARAKKLDDKTPSSLSDVMQKSPPLKPIGEDGKRGYLSRLFFFSVRAL